MNQFFPQQKFSGLQNFCWKAERDKWSFCVMKKLSERFKWYLLLLLYVGNAFPCSRWFPYNIYGPILKRDHRIAGYFA